MTDKPFHIYRSSAGSGKTRVLAREYIQLALRYPDYFKYILAMTFTNKSTQEMKDRILHYLHDFANDKSQDLAIEIIEQLEQKGFKLPPAELKQKSTEILSLLLHRYSEFSISTIDAFFQRVIRSFTRETGLLGNFRLEVENDLVLEKVVSLLMDELSHDDQLRKWVLDFSEEKLEEGENWDIRKLLLDFASLIKDESFKKIEEEVLRVTADKDFFKSFRKKLNDSIYPFEKHVEQKVDQFLSEFKEKGLTHDEFKNKSRGSVFSYINKLKKEIELPSAFVRGALEEVEEWPHPKSPHHSLILQTARARWQPQLSELVEYIEQNFRSYQSAKAAVKNLYSFGLLADIIRIQKKYLSDENLLLLSDAPKFLNVLMREQDTSFIYEKVGSFYRHYLIDEFQDTSGLQWGNLLPLVQNGIAQNYKSLIVGDIKQSIYRWRGGDLSILQQKVKNDVKELQTVTHTLNTNYRSDANIVKFNNSVFKTAAELVSKQTGDEFPKQAYQDAEQQPYKNPAQGYVNIQFLNAKAEEKSFSETALDRLPKLFEDLQSQGVNVQDIAFLVRDNKDGQKIAARFIEHKATADTSKFKYDVVSNESLMLYRAPCIVVLINALRVIADPNDLIARANLAYEYQKIWPTQTLIDLNEIFADSKTKSFGNWTPASFIHHRDYLSALSLFEMVENLIHLFNLGQLPDEVIYIQSFQDLVQEFTQREKSDLTSFLDWWELNKEKKSIQVAGGIEAAQIITIHRAKGLQFKYVIIPFLDWDLGHGNKAPLLWVQSKHALFKEAGFVPVKYSKDLAETFFAEQYAEETRRIQLDNLNLLYVAFTRAERGLIAFAPLSESSESKRVGQLVLNCIKVNEQLSRQFREQEQQLLIGSIIPSSPKAAAHHVVSLRNYTVTQWRDRLAIRKRGVDYFQPGERRAKVNQGILVHSALAKISSRQKWQDEWKSIIRTGEIAQEDCAVVEKALSWLINQPVLAPLFDPQNPHKTEVALFLQNGEDRRIDRISFNNKQVWLLDYKTGEESSADSEQVKEYVEVLRKMGYQIMGSFLVYISDARILEV
ncbi:MAG: UvrD-helicase domain-containing protein [Cytophagales bacterium]